MNTIPPPILQLRHVDYLLRQPRPELLISDFLARDSVTLLASQPYTGKTFLALEMMRSVAYGDSFLGHFRVPRPGNVLYLGNDSPAWDLASQFDKLIGLPDPRIENVPHLLAETPLGAFGFIFDTSFMLNTGVDAERVIQAALKHSSERTDWTVSGTDLIIIDTLRSVHGFEENDNTSMQHMMNMLRSIASRTKAAVVALHHFNKGNKESEEASLDRLRGASCQGGAVDTVYALTKKGEGVTKVHVLKNRPCPNTKDFVYDTNATTDGIELRLGSQTGMDAKKDEVYDFLLAQPSGWVKSESLPMSGTNRVLAALEKDGKIIRVYGAVRLATTGGVN